MNPISTTLPTEEGYYLFAGSRSGYVGIENLAPEWCRAEIVRVHRDSTGKLGYIGLDFFHQPEKAVGSWMRIDDLVGALRVAAAPVLLERAARTAVPEMFVQRNWRSLHRDQLVDYLGGAYKEERKDLAGRAVDLAVELGVLKPSTEYTSEGWLQPTKREG